jgi:hypothetical protein
MNHKHGLRIGDEIQLKNSIRYLYENLPVTYSDIDCKDLKGLITYKVVHVAKCGNYVTVISPITNEKQSISTSFVRQEFLLK